MSSHEHDGFPWAPDEALGLGFEVDGERLGKLVGASWDGCRPCQQTLKAELASDPRSTTALAAMSATAVHSILGGIPDAMALVGPDSPPYNVLVQAGLDGSGAEMLRAAEWMDDQERAEVLDTALDTIVGVMTAAPE
jgi:hypothetical protein